jgi:hypothetical protein
MCGEMTDDDGYEAYRDGLGLVPHHSDPLDGDLRLSLPIAESYCDTCRLFHGPGTACAVARAAVEALIIEEGELLGEAEIGDCDRVALLAALRLRGLAIEPDGDRWRVVGTVAA